MEKLKEILESWEEIEEILRGKPGKGLP